MIENNHGESNSNDDTTLPPSRSPLPGDGDCQRLPHAETGQRGPDVQLRPISGSIKLERHDTAASGHSSSSNPSYPNRSGNNAVPFPNSPALSTFSKNSSSQSGSSQSSAARLSVDDVLGAGSISLDARAKRARMMNKHAKKSHAVSTLSQGRARKRTLKSSGSDERRSKRTRLKQQEEKPKTGVRKHEMGASTEQIDARSTSPARSWDKSKPTGQHAATDHVLPSCSEISEIAFPVADRPDDTVSKQQRSHMPEDVDDEPETIELAMSNLVSKYNDCIACREEISPFKVAQALPPVLEFIDIDDPKSMNSEETAKAEQGLVQVFKSVDRVKWEVINRHSKDEGDQNKEASLFNTIQIQIWVRMTIWKLEQENGWEFFLKVVSLAGEAVADNRTKKPAGKKKKRKPKGGKVELSHRESFIKDIKMLAELAPYVLPPSVEFSLWLKDVMTFGFRESLPDFGAEIFEHFEIELAGPIALKRHGTDQSSRSERSEISHSPAAKQAIACNASTTGDMDRSPTRQLLEGRTKRQNAYYESLAEDKVETNSLTADDETATITGSMTCSTTGSLSTVTANSRTSKSSIREKDDTILFKTSVSLTSKTAKEKKNPFLKDSARGAYVGSHLSSKLSNITTLFREVKAPPRPIAEKKPKKPSKRPTADSKRKRGGPEQLMGSSIQVSTTAATQRKSNARNSLLRSSTYPGDIPADMQMSQLPTRLRATSINANSTTAAIRDAVVEETPTVQRAHVHFRDRNSFASQPVVAETPAVGVAETPLLARPPPAPATRMPKPWKMSGDELRGNSRAGSRHKKMPSVNETKTT